MKNFTKLLSVLIFVLAAATLAGYIGYKKILSTPIGTDGTKKVFVVSKGTTGYVVLDNLVTEGVLNKLQSTALKVYVKLNEAPKVLEGTYKIPLNITPIEVLNSLEHPELSDVWVTIPEGLRADQIATIIENEYKDVSNAVFSASEFMKYFSDKTYIETLELGIAPKTLEGFLFPDKYLLPAQATTDYVVRTLVNNYKKKAGNLSYKNLIIASIIEKEGITDADRALMADVVNKRLIEGWTLGMDVTLLYYYKDWKRDLSEADLKLDQPYNTRIKTGLPPTPICNPGMSSINGVLKPKANPYYYFIAANGKVYFAKTVAEHNANIAKYLN